MAAEPIERVVEHGEWSLQPFQREFAAQVVSWVSDEREQFWLAPRVGGALTADTLLAWHDSQRHPYLLRPDDDAPPVAYGEANVLDGRSEEYWLGHLIVAPSHRGRGVGRMLTRLLLRAAFEVHGARRVSLVVFGDNVRAVRCYQAVGMRHTGFESHEFSGPERSERLMRFVAERSDVMGGFDNGSDGGSEPRR